MKIVQFGEGNFLRTFVDLYFDTLNKEYLGNYEVSIIKSVPFGSLDNFYKQNNKYHVVLRGRKNNKDSELVYKVDSIKEAIDLFVDSKPFFDLAKDKDIVLVLGKGNETYQKLKNETIYFNDVEEAYKAVENRKKREKVTN